MRDGEPGGSGEPGAVDLAVEMGPCLAACDRGEQRAEDDPGERDQRGVLSAPSSTGMRGRLSWLKTLYCAPSSAPAAARTTVTTRPMIHTPRPCRGAVKRAIRPAT